MTALTGSIQIVRKTAAQWTAANTVLLAGQPALESDTLKLKIGNGTTAWNSLAYIGTAISGTANFFPIFNATGDNIVNSASLKQAATGVLLLNTKTIQSEDANVVLDFSSGTQGIFSYANAGQLLVDASQANLSFTGARVTASSGIIEAIANDEAYLQAAIIYIGAAGQSTRFTALTGNTVPYLNANKALTSSAVTPTELGYVSGATSNLQAQISALVTGYALILSHLGTFNPLDATTYFFGSQYGSVATTTTGDIVRCYVPKAGNVTSVVVFQRSGVAGTSEASTLWLRVVTNGGATTTDYEISAAINNSVVSQYYTVTLNAAVVKGDYILAKWITPTWVTNPTTVFTQIVAMIE